jgi:hypothetical protein
MYSNCSNSASGDDIHVFVLQYVSHVLGSKFQLLARHPRFAAATSAITSSVRQWFALRFASGAVQPADDQLPADEQSAPAAGAPSISESANAVMAQEQAELVAMKLALVAAFPLFHDYCTAIETRGESLSIRNWTVCVLAISVPMDQVLAVAIFAIMRRSDIQLDVNYGTGVRNLWHPVQYMSHASFIDQSTYVAQLLALGVAVFSLFIIGEA